MCRKPTVRHPGFAIQSNGPDDDSYGWSREIEKRIGFRGQKWGSPRGGGYSFKLILPLTCTLTSYGQVCLAAFLGAGLCGLCVFEKLVVCCHDDTKHSMSRSFVETVEQYAWLPIDI
jgi:hypothetical protein